MHLSTEMRRRDFDLGQPVMISSRGTSNWRIRARIAGAPSINHTGSVPQTEALPTIGGEIAIGALAPSRHVSTARK